MKVPVLVLAVTAACGGSNDKTTTPTTATTPAAESVIVDEESVEPALAEESVLIAPLVAEAPTGAPPPATRDKDSIRRVIRTNLSGIQKCYEVELIKQPGLQGTTLVTFMITPSGQVESAVGSGFEPTVDLCVADFIATLTFPAAMVPTQVNYPFKFSQGDPTGSPTP